MRSCKRIAILVPCLSLGGAERQISLIAPRLLQSGFEVIVISMISPLAFVDEMSKEGVKIFSLNMQQGQYSLKALFRLLTILKKNAIKCLITFNYPANITGRILKLFFPALKLITSIRSSTFGSSSRTSLMKITRGFDETTVVNSNVVARAFLDEKVILGSRLKIILNGVIVRRDSEQEALRRCGSKLRKEFVPTSSDCFVWVAVGRHEVPKDYPTLIDACSLFDVRIKNWILIIVGDGSLKEATESYIREKGLEKKILLVGKKENVFPYYYAADAYVSSSAWEGMPNTLIEAMLHECPAVATSVGEVPNLLKDKINGYIASPRNAKSIADAMTHMMQLTSPDRCNFVRTARQMVTDQLNIDKIVNQWKEVLKAD